MQRKKIKDKHRIKRGCYKKEECFGQSYNLIKCAIEYNE